MDPAKAIFVFVAAVFFALAPALQGGFGGFEPGQFPIAQEAAPAQPAGYAFAIWLPIYLGLLVMAGAGLFVRARDEAWEATRLPLILSLAPGAAWIGVARLSPVWATALIWWMLACALVALFRSPHRDRWLLQAPVAVYAGWLTAACWVALALIGAGHGIGPGATGWAVIALAGATASGALVQIRLRRAPEYGAALVWALAAIAVANAGENMALALLAALAAGAMGTLAWHCRQTDTSQI